MNRLARIARSATPSTGVQFRKTAYGREGLRSFLRDVLALANAPVQGYRYIVTGVEFDALGKRAVVQIDDADFSGKPPYQTLVADYIEPPVRIRYLPVTIGGKRAGVFEIGDCQDRPYMMRVDHCEALRRGDAYARKNDDVVKLGRAQLQALFEKKFRDSISGASIEIGFAGDIIHKQLQVATLSLADLPSAIAGSKLHELVEAKSSAVATNTAVERLTYARLYGSDSPYRERSTDTLVDEMRHIESQYRDEDEHFLFEKNKTELRIVVFNQGEEALLDASIRLLLPNRAGLKVASRLPKLLRDGSFVERSSVEQSEYPSVSIRGDAVRVTAALGEVAPGASVDIFSVPLRICAERALKGRRLGIQYVLHARNLRSPAKGILRLLF